MKKRAFWIPFGASLLLTPVFLAAGIGSAGAGHGDYVLARILFPYAWLAALVCGLLAAPLVVPVAVAQFPLYGLALGAAARRGRPLGALCVIAAAHAVAAVVCFLPAGDNF